jgi:hypothetical protein
MMSRAGGLQTLPRAVFQIFNFVYALSLSCFEFSFFFVPRLYRSNFFFCALLVVTWTKIIYFYLLRVRTSEEGRCSNGGDEQQFHAVSVANEPTTRCWKREKKKINLSFPFTVLEKAMRVERGLPI